MVFFSHQMLKKGPVPPSLRAETGREQHRERPRASSGDLSWPACHPHHSSWLSCLLFLLLEEDEAFEEEKSVPKAERCEHRCFSLPGPRGGSLVVSVRHNRTCWTRGDRAQGCLHHELPCAEPGGWPLKCLSELCAKWGGRASATSPRCDLAAWQGGASTLAQTLPSEDGTGVRLPVSLARIQETGRGPCVPCDGLHVAAITGAGAGT